MRFRPIIASVLLMLIAASAHSQTYPVDTLYKKDDRMVTSQKIDRLFSITYADGDYRQRSYLFKDKKTGKWAATVDTVFNPNGQYQAVIKHYYFKGDTVFLLNIYDRNPFTDADLRNVSSVIVDSIHFTNSFRLIDGKEVNGQYIIAWRHPTIAYRSRQYLSAIYSEINEDSLILEDYGLALRFDQNTKFIKEIEFSDRFFKRSTPRMYGRFRRIVFLNDGRDMRIE